MAFSEVVVNCLALSAFFFRAGSSVFSVHSRSASSVRLVTSVDFINISSHGNAWLFFIIGKTPNKNNKLQRKGCQTKPSVQQAASLLLVQVAILKPSTGWQPVVGLTLRRFQHDTFAETC